MRRRYGLTAAQVHPTDPVIPVQGALFWTRAGAERHARALVRTFWREHGLLYQVDVVDLRGRSRG